MGEKHSSGEERPWEFESSEHQSRPRLPPPNGTVFSFQTPTRGSTARQDLRAHDARVLSARSVWIGCHPAYLITREVCYFNVSIINPLFFCLLSAPNLSKQHYSTLITLLLNKYQLCTSIIVRFFIPLHLLLPMSAF